MQSLHSPPLTLTSPNIPKSQLDSKFSFSPPENPFSHALLTLRACAVAQPEDTKTGPSAHARMVKSGLDADVFIGNSLIDIYSKVDRLVDARKVFDHMPHRTVVSWTSIMSAYNRHRLPHETILLFTQMLECEVVQPNEFTLAVLLQACALRCDRDLAEIVQCLAVKTGFLADGFLLNSLVDAFVKSGMLAAAEKLVLGTAKRDVVSWSSVISGLVSSRGNNAERAVEMFCRMLEDGVSPNDVTMVAVLKACSVIRDFEIMRWVHGLVMTGNWSVNSLVLNSLMEMYSVNGYLFDSVKIFSQFSFNNDGRYPSVETMANLLQGCGNYEELKLGEEIHGFLIKHGVLPCTVAENSLVNMYAKNGLTNSAFLLFTKMVERDIISWNTIMNCLVKNGDPSRTLTLLRQIHLEGGPCPDFLTFLTSLKACADLALLAHGQVIHGYLTKTGLLGDTFVQNSIIDMYAKSGNLDHAKSTFDEMLERDIGSWNSIIAAHGTNGDGISALNLFSNIEKSSGKSRPNSITFVNVLSACAHAGLVEQGLEIFHSIESKYGLSLRAEHYACVVDLLGRAGRVEEAELFVRKMPIKPGPDVWGALLSACVLAGNLGIAERVAKELSVLEPESGAWRVALANAYAAAGEWRQVAAIRAEMRESGWGKEGGWSSVNVDGFEVRFMAGETECLESWVIYDVVGRLGNHVRDAWL
ncbi:pentatricopeptide repeat-containing protein [Striga asiatica]|uniref:Pentatricopeptide repeat-containing protein n=1 Tax=Striga asiatica TaxID=4170 RepID=A0A5A7P2C3_STRAF|nr:pentatricopeptide repeat-containing protein [Striga asiatica]